MLLFVVCVCFCCIVFVVRCLFVVVRCVLFVGWLVVVFCLLLFVVRCLLFLVVRHCLSLFNVRGLLQCFCYLVCVLCGVCRLSCVVVCR